MPKPIIPDTLGDAVKQHAARNKFKAQVAKEAVLGHMRHTRVVNPFELTVTREDVIDLVTNLKHACNQAGYDWQTINRISTTHFHDEVNH